MTDTDNRKAARREFWKRVHKRYVKIRYGPAGRIIGYVLAFTFITLFIFATIMAIGYYTTHRGF